MTHTFPARRVVGATVAVLFVLCTVVQFNDPDPAVWIALYGSCVVLAAAFAIGRNIKLLPHVVGAIAVCMAVAKAPAAAAFVTRANPGQSFFMKAGDATEENARECGGLLLVAAWCITVVVTKRTTREVA